MSSCLSMSGCPPERTNLVDRRSLCSLAPMPPVPRTLGISVLGRVGHGFARVVHVSGCRSRLDGEVRASRSLLVLTDSVTCIHRQLGEKGGGGETNEVARMQSQRPASHFATLVMAGSPRPERSGRVILFFRCWTGGAREEAWWAAAAGGSHADGGTSCTSASRSLGDPVVGPDAHRRLR